MVAYCIGFSAFHHVLASHVGWVECPALSQDSQKSYRAVFLRFEQVSCVCVCWVRSGLLGGRQSYGMW